MGEDDWGLAMKLVRDGANAMPTELLESGERPKAVELYARILASFGNEALGISPYSLYAQRRITVRPDGETEMRFLTIIGHGRSSDPRSPAGPYADSSVWQRLGWLPAERLGAKPRDRR